MHQGTRKEQDSARGHALYVAFELSKKTWKLALGDGSARRPRLVNVPAGELARVAKELATAKARVGLAADVPVRSCYEAGRDGFWIHRALEEMSVDTLVVDASSLSVERQSRRAKSDRLDAQKLYVELGRHWRGEKVWRVVRVPSVEAEDWRQLHRELEVLTHERTAHRVRIQSLLVTQGCAVKVGRRFGKQMLPSLRTWNGRALPSFIRARIEREWVRLEQVDDQIRELEHQRAALMSTSTAPSVQKAKQLVQLRSIGESSAWTFAMEMFGWRQFKNRREVGASLGMTGTPYDSGTRSREQGISKTGNARLRPLSIQLAWSWLRYQPQSKLARWFETRFGGGGARMRRIGIVAVARRLVIDLWRFVEFGVVPEGARLKPEA